MKVKELIRNTKRLEQQIATLQTQHDENIMKLQKFFDDKKIKSIEVEQDSESDDLVAKMNLEAVKKEIIRITYFPEKLKLNLAPEIYNEIINKSYSVRDIEKLKKLLKLAGVSATEFKSCISVEETVNREVLKQLYDVGDIKKADLDGCYSATISKSIKIKEKGGSN